MHDLESILQDLSELLTNDENNLEDYVSVCDNIKLRLEVITEELYYDGENL